MHRRRHEYTPIARVVLAFIATVANFLFLFRHCCYGHHRRFPLFFFHTGSGVNHPTHDGGDGVIVSVVPKRKVAGREGESEHHPCDGSMLMSCLSVDMITPPSHRWFSLSSLPPATFVLASTLLLQPSPPFPSLLPHGQWCERSHP